MKQDSIYWPFVRFMIKSTLLFFVLTFSNSRIIGQMKISPGAESFKIYLPMLEDKKVGVVAHQASLLFNKIENQHLVDFLIKNEVDVNETFIRSNKRDIAQIKTFKTLKKLKFLEFPKKGFLELDPIIKKINKLSGGILLIDYGYLKSDNLDTLQAVMDNKKISMEDVFNNLGKADVTSIVNFNLCTSISL